MPHSLKTYVKTVDRHRRIMVFVDGTISKKGL